MKPSLDDLKNRPRMPIFAVLDKIRSMYNVGSVFRTSDAVMLEKLYLCGYTACPPRKEITKTALGGEESVPWEHFDHAVDAVKHLKKQGVQIVALELTKNSIDYRKAEFKYPTALVIGHEVDGISDEVMKEVDLAIDIPMLGRANSLNVATAYGIAIFEILKKYKDIENPYR